MNSVSSIISSFQVCIRVLASSSLSVMAGEGVAPVNPEITVPVVPTQPGGTPPVTNDLGCYGGRAHDLSCRHVGGSSVEESENSPALLEDQEESDDPIVLAKQQLKVMTSLHNVCVNQFFAHETSLKAQMVETKSKRLVPIFFYIGWVWSNMKCSDWQIIWKRIWIWELRHWITFRYPFKALETSLEI